jgi:cobalt-zinc-cadmium efflux system membrane fusion protein
MFVEAAIVVDSKRSSHSTEALITENNKNFVLLLGKEKNTYYFKK